MELTYEQKLERFATIKKAVANLDRKRRAKQRQAHLALCEKLETLNTNKEVWDEKDI